LPLLMGSSTTFDKSNQPYQTFNDLIKTRNNRLVHFKPKAETDKTEKPVKQKYFSELISDVSLAERYWKCVSEMIYELHSLTLGKTEMPNFLKGSRYTSTVWAEFKFKI